MAATKTVSQLSQSYNSLTPRHGVVTLFGYGIQVRVDRGHLLLEDGIGPDRRQARFPRVGHGLRRLVVIGSDGMVSLAALRWLADQDAAFVMLDRDGSVLATTGPVRSSDAKLRRAQALAHSSGAALRITRELIKLKLAGQEQVAGNKLLDASTAQTHCQTSVGGRYCRHNFNYPPARITSGLRLLVGLEQFADQLSKKCSSPCARPLAYFWQSPFAADWIAPSRRQSSERNIELSLRSAGIGISSGRSHDGT